MVYILLIKNQYDNLLFMFLEKIKSNMKLFIYIWQKNH